MAAVGVLLLSNAVNANSVMHLSKQFQQGAFPVASNSLQFNLYATQDGLEPLASQNYFSGEWQLRRTDHATVVSADFDDTDGLPEQGELWLEVVADGFAVGERTQIQAAASVPGVTFALGNNLNMSLNRIISLDDPVDDNDAATKQYVDQAASFTETDPSVGTLTADKWCVANGSGTAVDCVRNPPVLVESDPTITDASIKDGVSWSEVSNRPSGLDDGDDLGVTAITPGTGLVGSSSPITTTGTLSVAVPLQLSGSVNDPNGVITATNSGSGYGVKGYGNSGGAYFQDTDYSAEATIATDGYGVRALGTTYGGYFKDSTDSGYAYLGSGDSGVDAFGSYAGGIFSSLGSTGSAYLAKGDVGIEASGDQNGGKFTTAGGDWVSAVSGIATATGAISTYGGWFETSADTSRSVGALARGEEAYAVKGLASAEGTAVKNYGGYFEAMGGLADGVVGRAPNGYGTGVYGYGKFRGVSGLTNGNSDSANWAVGVRGEADNSVSNGTENHQAMVGVEGVSSSYGASVLYGVYGQVVGTSAANTGAYAVYGDASQTTSVGGPVYAGYFWGDVHVSGTLSKSAGSFIIDHPLDPENRTLSHSFVESPDMKNVYDGNVVLDEQGEAVIEMPAWFEALNKDFRYQLTPLGGFAPVYVAEEIQDNRFRIAGGTPGMKVSWQVTGIRHDAYAEKHRIPVEQDKPEAQRGTYLNAEAWGMPKEKDRDWMRNHKFPESSANTR